ncbi:MAG: hypothetical protein HFH34_16315 [Eubacterium sp.]|nr:hypothetical protein [Eubacterium sp.]
MARNVSEETAACINWKYIIVAIIVGVLAAGVFLKVLTQKYCGGNKKNRAGRKSERKSVRKNGGKHEKEKQLF